MTTDIKSEFAKVAFKKESDLGLRLLGFSVPRDQAGQPKGSGLIAVFRNIHNPDPKARVHLPEDKIKARIEQVEQSGKEADISKWALQLLSKPEGVPTKMMLH